MAKLSLSLSLTRNLSPPSYPSLLGLPARFAEWREGQREAVEFICRARPRFHLLSAPTGAGKSLTYAALAQMLKTKRVLILTSTRGLQDQLQRDFEGIGYFDVRGASNYPCLATERGGEHEAFYSGRAVACDEGPCRYGYACTLREVGCAYYDRVARASRERVVVANYSFLFHTYYYGQGIGQWDVIVCDEAHEAPDELAGFLATELDESEMDVWCPRWPGEMSIPEWRAWAGGGLKRLTGEIEAMGGPAKGDRATVKKLKRILAKLQRLDKMSGEWIAYQSETKDAAGQTLKQWRWAPLWPAPYAEELLFREAPRVIFTSATARPKTLQLLGVGEGEFDSFETDHSFEVENRKVCLLLGREYVPQVRYNWTETDIDLWVKRHDDIIAARLDRKGLVHTTSYSRAKLLRERSKFARYMWVPWSGNTREKVEGFKRAQAPAVLVSPAVTTGWDFPGDAARYQIISKVPFPDTTDPVTVARSKADKDYAPYLAAVATVQAAGRIVRGADDWGETFTVDGNFSWFLKQHERHFPGWFLDAVYKSYDGVPTPPQYRKGAGDGE